VTCRNSPGDTTTGESGPACDANRQPAGADLAGRCERTGGASECGDGARRGLGGRPASGAGGRMPSSVPHLRRARRAASLRVQLSPCVSVCTIRSLRASQPAHRSRPAAGSDMRERGRGNKPYTTIRVRQAHKSLHRRSHKGGRGGGLMSARRASRRLTGGAPGIPGNNNQPPRRQQRVSVAARLSFRSRRLPDPAAGPSASSCSAHTASAGRTRREA
jgi:hypothetical protein